MSQDIFAGLKAGLILAAVLVVYMLVRGKVMVDEFKELDEAFASLSGQTLFWLFMGVFILISIFFGVLAGVVFSMVGSLVTFVLVAFGLALIFSVLAIVSKTPMMVDKVVWNLAIAIVLRITVPVLACG